MLFQKLFKLRHPNIWRKNITALQNIALEKWWQVSKPTTKPPVFVVGCSRSGTTITYETILSANEVTGFGYEIPQFWDGLYGPNTNEWLSEAAGAENARPEFRDRFFSHCYARLGHGRVIDKTCINVLRIPFLLKLFPEARFVFIHRDGRDNISSMIDGWRDGRFELGQFLGPSPDPVRINSGQFSHWHFFLPPNWRNYNQASLEEVCAYQWIISNELALEAREKVARDRWIEVRYEDILDRPYELFESIFSKLNFEFSPPIQELCASLNKKPTSMVTGPPVRNKWKSRNPREIEKILPQITPLMERLGRTI